MITIDRKLLPMKAHFLLYGSGEFQTNVFDLDDDLLSIYACSIVVLFFPATAPVVPFIATYSRQLGFSKVTVGLVTTLMRLVSVIARPVFGYFGDRYVLESEYLKNNDTIQNTFE